jgi:hypothetical protein
VVDVVDDDDDVVAIFDDDNGIAEVVNDVVADDWVLDDP